MIQSYEKGEEMSSKDCASALTESQILNIHRHSEHAGIKRTGVRHVSQSTTKAAKRYVIKSKHPAPLHWRRGILNVDLFR